jgi:hypothetical protein
MTLNSNMVEQLAEWCLRDDSLADVRAAARRDFFGYDDPGEAHYMEGAGGTHSRERRFLGWFAFGFKLPDGRCPAELAANAILSGNELPSAIDSIRGSRFVLAMVAMVSPGRGLMLKLEDEEFTVENRQLSRLFNRDDALYALVIPAGRRGWLVGPGWLQWPIRILPGMQAMLKNFQLGPIELERFLQQRLEPAEERPKVELPRDDTLKAAVARMTEAAKAEGRRNLVMTPAQWKKLVLSYLEAEKFAEFGKEIVERVGEVDSTDEVNKWLGLATNIWNNTPQPDRGGKSAIEISQGYDIPSGGWSL